MRDLFRDIGPGYVANGLIGLIFAASGPVAVILGVGTAGGLTAAEMASWIFGIFFVAGLLTIVSSLTIGSHSVMPGRFRAPSSSVRHWSTSPGPR